MILKLSSAVSRPLLHSAAKDQENDFGTYYDCIL